ncbi:MAG: tRNA (N(6)-L-threonylcarbamoyladenosine(37)-C(2))-methylthiotransferase MtaB [Oscillospiraceae bacterium]
MPVRAAFFTLGCKVNQYETEVLKNYFANDGFDIVDIEDQADIFVINSCTVTSTGDKKTKQLIRKIKRQNPNAIVALTGCFPQAFPSEAASVIEAQVVTGAYNRKGLLAAVKEALATGKRVVDITSHKKGEQFEHMQAQRPSQKTRAFVKIEDGCDRYCSYCIIPTARGPIRSKTMEDLKEELISIAQNGAKEVVLVGINLSSYGKDFTQGKRLVDAVELACSIDGLQRIRLGSLEPELLSDKDLQAMASFSKFCPQFHLSLQSGCDMTLQRMNRHYDTAEYKRIVDLIRSLFVNPSITTDIMVGFAGETQEEFIKSLNFAKEIGFAKAHVFAYSIREGTKAAKMQNQLDKHTKDLRSKQMIKQTLQSTAAFLSSQIETTAEVLVETKLSTDEYIGYSKNYTPVVIKSQTDICGKIVEVKITASTLEHCIGAIK